MKNRHLASTEQIEQKLRSHLDGTSTSRQSANMQRGLYLLGLSSAGLTSMIFFADQAWVKGLVPRQLSF